MALVTVADVLQTVLAALPGGYQLAGATTHLEREVTWTMSARPNSPIFPTLKPGEMALAAAPKLRQLDPPASLPPLIQWLAERQAAALILRGPLDAAERDSAIWTAEHEGLPLLLIPESASLTEVERQINALVRERRDELYNRTAHLQEVQFQLAESPANGRGSGLDRVVQALTELVRTPVALAGPPPGLELHYLAPGPEGVAGNGTGLATRWAALAAQALAAWQVPAALRGARSAEPPVLALDSGADAVVLAAPILVRERLAGALLLDAQAPAAEIDKLSLARAAGICALEMARRQSVVVAETRTEQRLRGEFIADLLHQAPGSSEEVLLARARALGIEIAPAYAVALLAPPTPDDSAESRLEAAVAALGPARESNPVFQVLGSRLAILWPLTPRTPARGAVPAADQPLEEPEGLVWLARELRRQANQHGGLAVAAGVGRIYPGLSGAARSRQEAEQALWSAWHLYAGAEICRYSDLGIYRLLLPLREQHTAELRTFYEETLGALGGVTGNGDGTPHAKLLDTLDAFLAHGGNISETADALELHRNTLSYRLHRISEVAGLDLDDPGVRFRAQVALCVRRLLQS